jgi:hypothetical protein
MGANQSKLSLVPGLISQIATSKMPTREPPVVCVPLHCVRFSTTTPEHVLIRQQERRMSRSWKEQLCEHGTSHESSLSDLCVEWTAHLIAMIGTRRGLLKRVQPYCHTIDQMATLTMWLLEEDVKSPWKVLWAFLHESWSVLGSRPIGHFLGAAESVPENVLFAMVDFLDRTMQSKKRTPEVLACSACGEAGGDTLPLRKCACKTARYCSETCQRADWPQHKLACAARLVAS